MYEYLQIFVWQLLKSTFSYKGKYTSFTSVIYEWLILRNKPSWFVSLINNVVEEKI